MRNAGRSRRGETVTPAQGRGCHWDGSSRSEPEVLATEHGFASPLLAMLFPPRFALKVGFRGQRATPWGPSSGKSC